MSASQPPHTVRWLFLVSDSQTYAHEETDAHHEVRNYRGKMTADIFTSLVGDWLRDLLPPATVRQQRTDLRAAVEILLRELRVRVLENEQLLAQIDERDEVVRQLTAERDNLLLELAGRREPSAQRAKGFAQALKSVLVSVVLTTGAITGVADAAHAVEGAFTSEGKPEMTHMAIDLPGDVGDNLRFVSGACEVVITHSHEGDDDAHYATLGQYSFGEGEADDGGAIRTSGKQ